MAISSVIQSLRGLLARPVRFIHFIDSDAEHSRVEENDLGEVVYALAKRQICRNLPDLTQAFLLNYDSIKCNFKSMADLTEGLEKLKSKRSLLSTVLSFKFANQSVIDGSERVPDESQCGFANWDRHYCKNGK